jgi:hypothetical protein
MNGPAVTNYQHRTNIEMFNLVKAYIQKPLSHHINEKVALK